MVKYGLSSIAVFIMFNISYCNPPFLASDKWAEETLQSLTLKEKIGQLFMIAAASSFKQPDELLASAMQKSPYKMDEEYITKMIQEYNIGGIIFLFKSEPEKQIYFTKKYQSLSKIPLLIGLDAEWGLSMRLEKVVRYPRNMTLGAIQDEQLIYQMGYEVGQQCKAIGVHINFAPVADVNNNPKNPVIHDRSFGDDPKCVAQLAKLYSQGLQDAGVIACAKHFPGHGDTDTDSHFDLPVIKHNRTRLNNIELYPFKELVSSGVGAIMNAHLSVPELDPTPNLPSSLSYSIVTQELKKNLGFNGLVITDGLGMQAITKYYKPGELELKAFLAGNDILLCPLDVPLAIEKIETAIKSGLVIEEELNKRVLKILKAKAWVLNKQEKIDPDFLTREAYSLQKILYESAITLVKKSSDLNFGAELLNNSLIIQVGSLPENKLANNKKIFPIPVTLSEARSAKSNGYSMYLSTDCCKIKYCKSDMSDQELLDCLEQAQYKDTIIISVGQMNKFMAQKFGIASNTLSLITELKKINKKIIVIIFGTPYSLNYFNEADTIIVAYEDAVPMQKAAVKVLTGDLKATGKLPVNVKF